MKNNYTNSFQKKLKSYSALAGTVFAAVNSVNGQTVYTDINPDVTANTDGASYNLDLNNDGHFDFRFDLTVNPGSSSSSGYNKVGITPLDSNMVAASSSGAYIYPFAMNTGDTVKASLIWKVGSSLSMGSNFGSSYTYGNWPGLNDRYVGLKINVGGAIYYGWARLDVGDLADSFTIKDYAYMNAVDQPIVIGLSTGISEQPVPNNISIYSNRQTIHISSASAAEAVITVMNTGGQKVQESRMHNGSTEITLNDASAGAYLVSVKQDGYMYTKKIIIQ